MVTRAGGDWPVTAPTLPCLASQACEAMPRVEEPPDVPQLHRPSAYPTHWVLPLYSQAYLSPVIISKPLQQLSLDHMLSI